MMPDPGRQNPMPYFRETERRKLYTSSFSVSARTVSAEAPVSARIRWSQWTVEGTATRGFPACMNWRSAIWPVASCIATLSTRSRSWAAPRSQCWLPQPWTWLTRTFSARPRGRLPAARARAMRSGIAAYSARIGSTMRRPPDRIIASHLRGGRRWCQRPRCYSRCRGVSSIGSGLSAQKQRPCGLAAQAEDGVGGRDRQGAHGGALGLPVTAEEAVLGKEQRPARGAPAIPVVGVQREGPVEGGRPRESGVPANHRAGREAGPAADALDGGVDRRAL